MAWQFSVNNTVYGQGVSGDTSSDKFLYTLLTFLVSVGWTVTYSCDGTTMQAGNIFTKHTSGATGMGNMGAWFILKEPAGGLGGLRREFMFWTQKSGSATRDSIYIIYSAQGFTTADSYGTGTATAAGTAATKDNPPLAYDGVRYDTWGWNPTGNYSLGDMGDQYIPIGQSNICDFHIMAMNTPPFSWMFFVSKRVPGSANVQRGVFAYDGLAEYDPVDPDPTVIWRAFTDSGLGNGFRDTGLGSFGVLGCVRGWMNWRAFSSRADANTNWGDNNADTHTYANVQHRILSDSTFVGASRSAPMHTTPYSGKEIFFPVPLVGGGGAKGNIYKGTSSIFRLTHRSHRFLETLSVASDRDWIAASADGSLVIPWNGSVPNQ